MDNSASKMTELITRSGQFTYDALLHHDRENNENARKGLITQVSSGFFAKPCCNEAVTERVLLTMKRNVERTIMGSSNDLNYKAKNTHANIGTKRYFASGVISVDGAEKRISYTYLKAGKEWKENKIITERIIKPIPWNENFFQSDPYDCANSITDKLEFLSIDIKSFILSVAIVKQERHGNCGLISNYAAWFLWDYETTNKRGLINRLEIVELNDFDHALVIINRSKGTLNDPDSWGNCWIFDGWGVADVDKRLYRSNDFQTNMSALKQKIQDIQEQKQHPRKHHKKQRAIGETIKHSVKCTLEIRPQQEKIPNDLISQIGFVALDEPFSPLDNLINARTSHGKKMAMLLQDLSPGNRLPDLSK